MTLQATKAKATTVKKIKEGISLERPCELNWALKAAKIIHDRTLKSPHTDQ